MRPSKTNLLLNSTLRELLMFGLPGGSASEGPATKLGCLFVVIFAVVLFSSLFAMLWYTAGLIFGGQ
jgi:hypothetical protein